MNNIAGFIQPSVDSVTSSMPVVATGGKTINMKMAMIAAIVVVVLFIIYRNMSPTNITDSDDGVAEGFKRSHFGSTEQMDPLTKCGWEVIVSPTCPYCVKQKQILSQHFPTFKNIHTDKPAEVVPTWHNTKTGKKVLGMQTYEELLAMTKC